MGRQVVYFCELIKNVIHPGEEYEKEFEIEWPYMIRLAKEHNLLPLLMEEAVKYSSCAECSEFAQVMAETVSIVATQIKRTKAFLSLYKAFTKEDVYPLVLKGLICRELYGDLCDHRPSGDEDIWIRPVEYQKVKSILEVNGYSSQNGEKTEAQLEKLQEVSFINSTENLHIELHFNTMGRENNIRSRMSDYFNNVFEDYREVEIDGVRVRTMNHQNHFLFLILHAFKHFTSGGFGIRQMLDILLYQERYAAEIDMSQLHETLKQYKADRFWTDIICLGNLYFGFKFSTLSQPLCPEELLEDMVLCGAFGNRTPAEVTAMGAMIVATGNRFKKKRSSSVIMVWKSIFPNRAHLLGKAPYLEEKPWLLPIEWIKRWKRFFRRNRNSECDLVAESLKISRRRMKLLKRYDLV